MTAPPARPYSAEYAFELTWNSCTASWLNWYGARPDPVRPIVWPKNVLLLSAPSTTRLLSVPRWPAKLMSPVRTSVVTPGVSSAKLMKFRPFTGRFWIAASPTVSLTCERVLSMIGAAALTLTVSATLATRSSIRSVSVDPIVRVMFPCFCAVNPWSSAETSYVPTGSSSARNAPVSSVTIARVMPVAVCVTVTVTPGSTAPD